MIIDPVLAAVPPLRKAVRDAIRADEKDTVSRLLVEARLPEEMLGRIAARARDLVVTVRQQRVGQGGLDAFLHEFQLSSKEGVVLMCLAEALLRIPDTLTIDKLIKDKIATADWQAHLGRSGSVFVNASTWALMLTGRVIRLDESDTGDLAGTLKRLIQSSGEPVIRTALIQAMRILGKQFVMGRNIGEALVRAKPDEARGYRYSYDMLGEAALTAADAEKFLEAYREAIAAIGIAAEAKSVIDAPGISVKLSALHPRYEFAQRQRVLDELVPRLRLLALDAKSFNIGLTVDAEEADRLDLSLDVIEAVSGDEYLAGWDGFGLAVQAYQKRCTYLLDYLAAMAHRHKRRLMVRLTKGAYWDTEIKSAQENGLDGYTVFTRKVSTDLSYLACVKRLFSDRQAFYPQFATHNAHSLAAVLEMAGDNREFEFQRLHGMGEALYDQIVDPEALNLPVRIYAPVGGHEELLAYLVRRLLENGANSSFVNRIQDEKLPIEAIIAEPAAVIKTLPAISHPSIPLPVDLYGSQRRNSAGTDLTNPQVTVALGKAMAEAALRGWTAAPLFDGDGVDGVEIDSPGIQGWHAVTDPADRRRVVGEVAEATADHVAQSLAGSVSAAVDWDRTAANERADCLDRGAALMEENRAELLALCVREAGKTVNDAVAELREAVDFCRYYAARARIDFAEPEALPGPTGENNQIALHGRGVFACISPWNFPLAIFTGQIAGALAAGNAVVAKPAEQTPLIAAFAVRLLHQAGVPKEVLHLLPGDGPTVGGPLVGDPRIAGVAFTGSTETAKLINLTLAQRPGPIVPLIAETGGQNTMIVDSSALPEQVVGDVITSAFRSAGQRCSALRVLFLQEDVADKMLTMLSGAMAELRVGDPALLATDIGPVIDEEAQAMLLAHDKRMAAEGRLIMRTGLGDDCHYGTFVAPAAFEIDSLARLQREVFGPILHVIRYQADRLDDVLDAVNGCGYGLTLGIHSRIDSTVRYIHQRLRVGNAYINRNMIGAVVGVQPFGGEGLSGTGPKAGGPRYLHRFATERTLSVDTTAAGGNASLMSLEEEGPALGG